MRRSWTLAAVVAAALIVSAAANRGIENDIPKECPTIDAIDKTIHLAHEWDCTKFYKCDHGKRVLFECSLMDNKGNRLHFDPVLQVCNWPDVVECISGPPPTTSEDSSEIPTKPTYPPTGTTPSSKPPTKPTQPPTGTTSSSRPPTKPTQPPTRTTPSWNQTESTPLPTDDVGQNSTPIPSGNLVPHESNCSLFYEIVNGTKVLRECPRGLHFSLTEEVCMLPSEAGCESTTPSITSTVDPELGSCGNIGNGWVVPHECVCSKYYLCSNGDLILQECHEGLHYSPIFMSCVDPVVAGCESTASTTVATVVTTVEIPTECPPDNSGPPVQLPHPTNCSLFYKCDNGKKVLLQCPKDLHFSPVLQMCDWADSAGCEVKPSSVVGGETSTKPTSMGSDGTTVSTSTIGIPTECPSDNSGQAVQLPHPYNCSLYYKCDNGKKIVQTCPIGLEFNAEKQICDWPESAGCVVSTIGTTQDITTIQDATKPPSSTTQGTTGPPSSTTQDTTRPPSSTTQNTTRPPTSTTQDTTGPPSSTTQDTTRPPSSTTQNTTRPPTSTTQDTTGPPSSTTQNTTRPPTSTTQNTTRPPTSTTQDTTGPPSSTTQDTTRPPSSTTQNTTRPPTSTTQDTTRPPSSTTQDATGPPYSTPKDTTRPPSSTTQDTTRPPSSTTQDTTWTPMSTTQGTTQPCEEGSKKPHPSNCSFYYVCEDDQYLLKECTDGLHFNPVLNICDWWEYAGCNQTTLITSSTTELPGSPQVTTDDYVGENTKPGTSITPTSTVSTTTKLHSTTTRPTGLPQCIGACPKRDPTSYTVLLTNEDCTKFCKCSNGRAYVYDCPARLHFSPTKFVCDYPKRAKCTGEGGWGQSNIEVIPASN